MFRISRDGATRNPVIIIGPIALKWAKNDCGRECNLFERDLYGRSSPKRRLLLCPALWASSHGQLLLMRSAVPDTEMMSMEEYLAMDQEWDCLSGDDDECPFEPGATNWGRLNGRRVALDYSVTVRRKSE